MDEGTDRSHVAFRATPSKGVRMGQDCTERIAHPRTQQVWWMQQKHRSLVSQQPERERSENAGTAESVYPKDSLNDVTGWREVVQPMAEPREVFHVSI